MAQTIALEGIISYSVFLFHEDDLIFRFHELRHSAVYDVQSIQSSILDVNPDIHFLQPPDLTDGFQCVPAKTAQRLHQDQVYFPFGTVSQELLIAGAVGSAGAGSNVGIYSNEYPVWITLDIIRVVGICVSRLWYCSSWQVLTRQ